MNSEEQIRIAQRDAPLALNRLIAMLASHKAEIIATAIADIGGGYETHGDNGFHKTSYQLDRDTVDDLGAALARQIIWRNRY